MVSKETMIKDLKEFFKDEDLTSITEETANKLIEMACWLYDYLNQEEDK